MMYFSVPLNNDTQEFRCLAEISLNIYVLHREKVKKHKEQIRDRSSQNLRKYKGQDMSQFHIVPYKTN